MGSCVDIHGSCCHERPNRCPEFGLPPGDMLVIKNHIVTDDMRYWMNYNVSQDHDDIRNQTVAIDHVWDHGPIKDCVCANDLGSCCQNKGHTDAQDLSCHLQSYQCSRTLDQLSIYRSQENVLPPGSIELYGPKLWPGLCLDQWLCCSQGMY